MKKYLNWITFVAVNGGLLFGLGMAGISGAVMQIKNVFHLNDSGIGIIVSSIMLGSLVGALIAGNIADKYGRKKTLILTSILFIIASLGCSLSFTNWELILFRFLMGIGVGFSSVVTPIYISEVAPSEKRGRLGSYFQIAITVGILLSYIFNFFFIKFDNSWRLMLMVPFIFGLLFFIFLNISFPESPRWLIGKNRDVEALKILTKIGGEKFAKKEFDGIKVSLSSETNKNKVKISEVFKGNIGKVVFLGICLAIFQQLTGINAIVNYAPAIFEKSGLGGDKALLESILVGFINFLSTFLAFWLVDSKGRKTLLIWGAIGMTITLMILTLGFSFSWNNMIILIFLLLYILSYAASFAPVFWIIISEIYPNRVRGTAMSVTTAVVWLSSFIVVQVSPLILNSLGGAFLFGVFGIVSLIALLFVYFKIPETKGKSLEELENELGLKEK